MRAAILPGLLAGLLLASHAIGQDAGLARPEILLRETVAGMPRGERQEVQVMTASFRPGDRTPFHTHRFPVTVLVLEGSFTLEMEGHPPLTIGAGQAYVEPPHTRMIGTNRSATDPLRVVIFYVAEPGTPFLDLSHQARPSGH